jgi:succinyl-CoA synthetase beta subunit
MGLFTRKKIKPVYTPKLHPKPVKPVNKPVKHPVIKAHPKPAPKPVKVARLVAAPKLLAPPKLLDERAWELLKAARVPVVPFMFVKREADLPIALKKVGLPAILKVSGPAIVHKTELGGIKTAMTEDEAKAAFTALMKIKGADRVLVQKKMAGMEIIVGAKSDPQFGHIVSIGLGGIYVELLRDVTFRIAPVGMDDAIAMLKELKGYDILAGARGQPAVNLQALADVLVKVSRFAVSEKVKEMDINPLFCTPEGCWAADVRIVK